MSKHKKVIVAVLATYLVLSFVPQLGIMSLIGGVRGGGSSGKGKLL